MPAVQEQDQDRADPHSLRRQTPLPGAAVHEHRCQDVHHEVGRFNSLGPRLQHAARWSAAQAGPAATTHVAKNIRSPLDGHVDGGEEFEIPIEDDLSLVLLGISPFTKLLKYERRRWRRSSRDGDLKGQAFASDQR